MKRIVEYAGPPIPSPKLSLLCEDAVLPVFSKDGTRLMAKISRDQRGRIWNIDTKEDQPFTLSFDQAAERHSSCYAFHPYDPHIVLIGEDGRRLFLTEEDVYEGKMYGLRIVHRTYFRIPIHSCGFFPDGTTGFAAASISICIFRIDKTRPMRLKKEILSPRREGGGIEKVLLSPNGNFFIVLTSDGSIYRLWRGFLGMWRNEKLVDTKETTLVASHQAIAISSDSQRVAYLMGHDTIHVVCLETREKAVLGLKLNKNYRIVDMAFSSCGQFLIVASNKMLRIFSTITWEVIASVKEFRNIDRFICSPNGRFIVVEGSSHQDDRHGLHVLDFGGLLLGTLPLDMAPFFV